MPIAVLAIAIGLLIALVSPAYAVDDGVYQIKASVMHATQAGQKSMANAAFENVLDQDETGEADGTRLLTLVVRNGEAYLEARVVPVERKLGNSSLTCYLGYLDYYPDYYGATTPLNQTPTAAIVDSYYPLAGDSSDGYNNAETGSDASLKGQRYPKVVSVRLSDDFENHSELWMRFYIPLMESINQGSGTQFAKMELDYGSIAKVTDADQVQTAEGIAERHASAVQNGYQYLANTITAASRQLLQTDTYTSASLKSLRSARDAAQSVYAARTADSLEVMKAIVDLSVAQRGLTQKSSSTNKANGSNNGGNSNGSKSNTSGKTSGKSNNSSKKSALDFAHLKNGTYTVYGEMIKTDRQQQSMANKAIDHSIRIKVKNGHYTVQMTFAKLHYSGKVGALGKLWYFKSGYKHPNGTLSGSTAQAKVLSYLTDSDGSRFKDEYGTNYPKTVSFPLIAEAKGDGWVPLQVLVPVMGDITGSSGVQSVYLKLHTDSVVSGSKKVSGSSTGTSSDSASTGGDGSSSDDGDSLGGLPSSDSDADSAGSIVPTAGSVDGNSGSGDGSDGSGSDAGTAAAAGADGADTGSGDGSGSSQGNVSSASSQTSGESASEPEPPMKRYLGLAGGGTAAAVFAGLGYALIRNRAAIAALIGVAH